MGGPHYTCLELRSVVRLCVFSGVFRLFGFSWVFFVCFVRLFRFFGLLPFRFFARFFFFGFLLFFGVCRVSRSLFSGFFVFILLWPIRWFMQLLRKCSKIPLWKKSFGRASSSTLDTSSPSSACSKVWQSAINLGEWLINPPVLINK